MKKLYLLIFLTLLWAYPALAEEIPATGQQGHVLGQTPPGTEGQNPEAAQQQAAPPQPESARPDVRALFEESLRQMMPLDERQIQEYRERSDQRERALLPVSPGLRSRTVRVSLEPGVAPVAVQTTANVATSLVFHDSTGQPWPITSVTNGGPSFFQVLRPELPDGNLLNVMPMQGYGNSTIVVTLENRDIPLVIRLESDSVRSPERNADALVLFQLAHFGPKAAPPLIENVRETASSEMLAFLDRVPPASAVRVALESQTDNLTVWRLGDKHYIRTTHTLVWPAWSAVVHGAGGTRCYEAPVTSRFMLSVNGQIQSVLLREGGRP